MILNEATVNLGQCGRIKPEQNKDIVVIKEIVIWLMF